MKQVLMWTLILTILFAVFIGVAFGVLTYLAPDPEALAQTQQLAGAASDTSAVVVPKKSEADSLRAVVDQLRSELFFIRVSADSLNQVVGQRDAQIAGYVLKLTNLERAAEEVNNKHNSIKDLAKTYATMKVSDIRPIIEQLDDKTVIALYNNMGSRTKKNLIQALSDVRAAQITRKLAGNG